MNDKPEYKLDDAPITWTALIKTAQELGYHEDSGMYCTSGAAKFLRGLGYTVGYNK